MSQTLPNIPFNSPLTDDSGLLTPEWSKWFSFAFSRVGGNIALSNIELAKLNSTNVTALQASVTALTTQLTAFITSTTANFNGLNQGPIL